MPWIDAWMDSYTEIAFTYKYKSDNRVAKTQRMPCLNRTFSAKEPYDQLHFCGKRPAT